MLKVSIFWKIKQKCVNLSLKVVMVKSVYYIFLTKRRILQIGSVHILRRQDFWYFLTPPSLSVDSLFSEAYVLA